MMFPCNDYYKLAQKLASEQNEASQRSAVSRAYYASLHKSRIFAESNGKVFASKGTPDIHREILDYFKYRDGVNNFSLANKLGRLRKNRNICDYDDDVRNIKSMAENATMDAKDFFDMI